MEIDERFIKVPIEELTTPEHGYTVYMDNWWVVRDGHVLGWVGRWGGVPTPQCNPNRVVAERMLASMYKGYYLQCFPVAYWPSHRDDV